MRVTAEPLFVVILTDGGQQLAAPRAVGPFDDFDEAQAFTLALTRQWEAETGLAPAATVARIESPAPGVVVGEI